MPKIDQLGELDEIKEPKYIKDGEIKDDKGK